MGQRWIYSITAVMAMGGSALGGTLSEGTVTAYTAIQEQSSQTFDFSHAKAMTRILPAELRDLPMIAATADTNQETNEKTVAEKGAIGSGSMKLRTRIPLTDIETDPAVAPQEFGKAANGVNLPYSTSRVDMYKTSYSRKYPYRAAGQLFFKEGDDTYVCSASMIKRGILVTAAHCVADNQAHEFYSDWQFIPARKGKSAPYGLWKGAVAYVMTKYLNDESGECISGVVCKDDVAVIVLEPQDGKYAGDYTGWFGYGFGGYSYINKKKAQITQLGYPVSHDRGRLMQRNDSMGIKGDLDYKLNTLIGSRMTGGSSGGPWLVNFGQRAKLQDTKFGRASRFNVIVGVTSWGYTDSRYKIQGASPFSKDNIKVLVDQACSDNPDACK